MYCWFPIILSLLLVAVYSCACRSFLRGIHRRGLDSNGCEVPTGEKLNQTMAKARTVATNACNEVVDYSEEQQLPRKISRP